MPTSPTRRRAPAGLGACGLALALALTACGSNDPAQVGIGSSGAAVPSASPSPLAQIDSLDGEDTAVTLAPAFLAGLTSLKLTPAPLGRATLEGNRIAFPITGGDVTYFGPESGVTPYVQGQIEHEGSGLSLTGPNGKLVELEDFVVDPGQSVLTGKVTVDGSVFAPSAPLFFLDGRTLRPITNGDRPGTAVLEGTTVSLTKTAADALNTVFATTALTEFFPVGVAEITVDTGA